ncbi:diaminobutyrate acetyltransferase [Seohaeicola saemankumensis]|uniref:L-2,4-diaminobutyric acid acetyltransferase n=1 Tax=Seohaeicola saemankumensis TaxID=481181 RepID=A0ABW3TA15_9RHOB
MSDTANPLKTRRPNVRLRKPTVADGSDVWALISACKPLDENSMYFNLIQCDHFADTCILAERDGQIVGWISGHIPPEKTDTLFVWQVAVSAEARGLGLAGRMLRALFDRPELADVSRIETTITRDNKPSWGLFRAFARKRGGILTHAPHFERGAHFDGAHATEYLVEIDFSEATKAAVQDAARAASDARQAQDSARQQAA